MLQDWWWGGLPLHSHVSSSWKRQSSGMSKASNQPSHALFPSFSNNKITVCVYTTLAWIGPATRSKDFHHLIPPPAHNTWSCSWSPQGMEYCDEALSGTNIWPSPEVTLFICRLTMSFMEFVSAHSKWLSYFISDAKEVNYRTARGKSSAFMWYRRVTFRYIRFYIAVIAVLFMMKK